MQSHRGAGEHHCFIHVSMKSPCGQSQSVSMVTMRQSQHAFQPSTFLWLMHIGARSGIQQTIVGTLKACFCYSNQESVIINQANQPVRKCEVGCDFVLDKRRIKNVTTVQNECPYITCMSYIKTLLLVVWRCFLHGLILLTYYITYNTLPSQKVQCSQLFSRNLRRPHNKTHSCIVHGTSVFTMSSK